MGYDAYCMVVIGFKIPSTPLLYARERGCDHPEHTSKFCSQCGAILNKDRKLGPRLVMLLGDRHDAIYQLLHDRNLIGRDDSNTVVLNDRQISKQHAVISSQQHEYWIEDTSSRNGVYVNGRRIQHREKLFHG